MVNVNAVVASYEMRRDGNLEVLCIHAKGNLTFKAEGPRVTLGDRVIFYFDTRTGGYMLQTEGEEFPCRDFRYSIDGRLLVN